MIRAHRYIGTMLLAAATHVPLVISGCAAWVYDEYHSDYHHWNDREKRAYRMWLAEDTMNIASMPGWTKTNSASTGIGATTTQKPGGNRDFCALAVVGDL